MTTAEMTNAILKELALLRSGIDRADTFYYTPGLDAVITDSEYDAMISRIKELCPDDERCTRVGPPYNADDLRSKTQHSIPMGSLDNTEGGIAGFRKWVEKTLSNLGVTSAAFMVSLKMDGQSIATYYDEAGQLARVITRGNGEVGEDITVNAAKWLNMPTNVCTQSGQDWSQFAVRGEVMLYHHDFERINERDGGEHANPRNLGNGIIGRTSGEDNESMRFVAFNLVSGNHIFGGTLSERFETLSAHGFYTVPNRLVNGDADAVVRAVSDWYREMEDGARGELGFDIDGLVVTLDDVDQCRELTKNKRDELRPKYATACKFTSYKAITTVIGCEITIGHDGRLAPTAKLDPVQIGGVTVSNALLNNWNVDSTFPSAAHVAIGDTVEVELAGDVIPKLTRVVEQPDGRKPIEEPVEFQGHKTTRMKRGKLGAVTYIEGAGDNAAVARRKIKHYIGTSKKGVGILGVGDGLLDALTEGGDNALVKSPADLYRLTADQIADIKIGTSNSGKSIRLGKSRADALVEQINAARMVPLAKFLGALGIELLGRRRVEIIAEEHGLCDLVDWDDEAKLATIPGDATRVAIIAGLRENRQLISELVNEIGVKVMPIKQKETATATESTAKETGKIAGHSFCFTGTRECLDEVQAAGGIIKSGVSAGLNYLVQKDATKVSNKTKKADQHGTKVISLDTLKAVLAGERDLPEATN